MIVRLKGGLGNQMFQYAFLRKLEIEYGITDIAIDDSFYNKANKVKITQYGNSIDDFNVCYKKAKREEIKNVCMFPHNQKPMTLRYRVPMALEMMLNRNYYHVRNFEYVDPNTITKYKYLDGSWQSWMYLEGIEKNIREEFTLRKLPSDSFMRQIREVRNEEAVFIGIRRGDYVINKRTEHCMELYQRTTTIKE